MVGKSLITASTVFSLGLALAGCTNHIAQPADPPHSHQMNAPEGSTELSGQDIMFAQMMIPHHQQAVDMGVLAETRAENSSVKELAAQIEMEQAPEIEQMRSWLKAVGASEDMGHEMHMDGMLSEAELNALSEASGADFDQLYLEAMIAHHEGAISMAEMVLNSGNPEVKALAEAIVSSQTKQIEYMRELLGKL